jgi:hypothetical protein
VDPHHVDADPDPTHYPVADPDSVFYLMRMGIRIRLFTLMRIWIKWAHIPNDLACHLKIDADPVPDPAYHFDADPDANPISDFYCMLIRIPMRIQVTKNDADPDPQHCSQASHHLIPGLSYPPHPLLHQSGSHFQPPPLFSEGFGPRWGPAGYPFDLPWSGGGSNMARPIRPIPQFPYAAPSAYSPPLFRPVPGDGFPTGSPEGRGSAFTRVSCGEDMPMDGKSRERAEAGQLEAIRGIGDGGDPKESNGASGERRSVFAKVADRTSNANYSSANYSSPNYSSANYRHSTGGVELPAAATSCASKNIVEQLVAADGSMLKAADGSLVDGSLLPDDDGLLAVAARNLWELPILLPEKPLGLETSFCKFLAFLLNYLCTLPPSRYRI